MNRVMIPQGYTPPLNTFDTQLAIEFIKHNFQKDLSYALNLRRVSAPLFVQDSSGLNDDLNGVERPVSFDIPATSKDAVVVHSLAKWKRLALKRYDFRPGKGLYTDMNAIRRDEDTDNLHSVFVDQWDWERIITKDERTVDTLKSMVRRVYRSIRHTERYIAEDYAFSDCILPEEITFITAQELEDLYPGCTPKEREYNIAKAKGAVFIMQIGGVLKSGEPHDGRAPDYDDWSLNGDIIVYYPVLDIALELSSMGIRVDEETLLKQLAIRGCSERAELPFQRALLEGRSTGTRLCLEHAKKP